jgi:hypothetical protein
MGKNSKTTKKKFQKRVSNKIRTLYHEHGGDPTWPRARIAAASYSMVRARAHKRAGGKK